MILAECVEINTVKLFFSDKSLREMALQKPKTKAEFLNISGVGQAKLKSYGQIMLAAIKNYLKEDAD